MAIVTRLALLYALGVTAQAIELDVNNEASIKSAASTIAYDMMTYYNGNTTGTPGLLPNPPYYWWEAGAMFGGLVDYFHYTGDSSYNDVVIQAFLAQASSTNDFMNPAVYGQLGNDDQVFWALSAMSAVEHSFPNPSASPTWLALATNTFNDIASRWNTSTCAGGVKWQIFPQNAGYDYKSSIANGASSSSRPVWRDIPATAHATQHVYDGTDDTTNCTGIDHDEWSYNIGVFLYGTAVMANITHNTSPWRTRTEGFINTASSVFFTPFSNTTNVMYELCEKTNKCDTDQFSFKAYLSRWLIATTQMIPELKEQVWGLIVPSAKAAAGSCTGLGNSSCGTKWWVGGYDGVTGVGQQLSAMELVQGLLVNGTAPPQTAEGN